MNAQELKQVALETAKQAGWTSDYVMPKDVQHAMEQLADKLLDLGITRNTLRKHFPIIIDKELTYEDGVIDAVAIAMTRQMIKKAGVAK